MADFRSDTVTQPDDGMRAAMVSAEVGDAVFGDDPTVLRLEARVASMLGKEAALFVASGTMANTLAMRVHLAPLEEVVCDYRCHVHVWENGGVHAHTGAAVSAVRPRDHGERFITARILEEYVRLDHSLYHTPTTTLVALENTLNGAVQPLDEMVAVSDWARQRGVATHLDGARLWNAAAATGVELERYGALFDTVSVCLSKGLGAPIGSVLVGDAKRIEKARHFHKLMGGAGVRPDSSPRAGSMRWSTTCRGSRRRTKARRSSRRASLSSASRCPPARRRQTWSGLILQERGTMMASHERCARRRASRRKVGRTRRGPPSRRTRSALTSPPFASSRTSKPRPPKSRGSWPPSPSGSRGNDSH